MFEVPYDEAAKRALMLRRDLDAPVADMPERRLMVALFGDAIRCIEKYRNARDARSKTRLAKELQWVLSDDNQSLFAFVRICEILDLDPLAVRRSLGLIGDARASRADQEPPAAAVDVPIPTLPADAPAVLAYDRSPSCSAMPSHFS